jgi:hypothetical protein
MLHSRSMAMVVAPVSIWLQANSSASAQGSPTQQAITEQAVADAALASAQSDYVFGAAGLVAGAAAKRLLAQGQPQSAALETLLAAAGNIIDKLA